MEISKKNYLRISMCFIFSSLVYDQPDFSGHYIVLKILYDQILYIIMLNITADDVLKNICIHRIK